MALVRLLPLLLLLSLGGCARLALMGSDDPLADIRAAREAGNFQRALYFAEHIDPEHPDYPAVQKELPALQSAIREFELRRIRRAEAAAAREEWANAYNILEEAMAQWRASGPLLDAHEQIQQAEESRRRQVLGDLLLSEARWRIARDPQAQQLQSLTDRDSRNRYHRWEERTRELARELARLADFFAAGDDWERVRDYLAAVQALEPDTAGTTLLDKARKELAESAREYRMMRHREQLEEARALLQRYQSTSQLHELLAVRKFLQQHQGNDSLAEMSRQVEKLTRERFRQDMERGEALYARGKYQEAYEVWKGIAPLAPNDAELTKKLERAEKVLSKIKSLGSD